MFDKEVLRLPGAHGMLALACSLALVRALAVIGQAVGLANVIVNVWNGQPAFDQLSWLVLFLVCFVGRQVVLTAQSSALDRYARDRAEELRDELLKRVFQCGPVVVQQYGSASVTSTVIQGVEAVRAYLSLIIPKMAAMAVIPLVLLCAIFPLDWVSGIIALVCFPFIILYMVMIGHKAKDNAAKRYGEFQQMANHFIDAVGGMDELKAFGRSRAYGATVYRASERFRELTMKTLRIATLSSAVLDVFSTLALAGVAVMLGFRLVVGAVDFFPALTVLILVPEYFRPIREFASDFHASLDGRSAFASIRAIREGSERLMDGSAVQSAPDATRAVEPLAEDAAKAAGSLATVIAPAPATMAGQASSLVLDSVSFSYPDFPQALSGISFSVAGSCKVGIIGTSGSGKSTLMSILGGFAGPDAGSVLLNGERVTSLRQPAWQMAATFIPQDPYLFHATLRENVAFYRPDATDDEIRRAISLAGLDDVVAELPQGLDTLIGEGGRVLSGGQAHRVALARAFLDSSRKVLLFDEPTAHLDIETELELKERMLPLMEGKLVFFATHRLHWVADMDYILQMEAGRIVWQGTPQEWGARRNGERHGERDGKRDELKEGGAR